MSATRGMWVCRHDVDGRDYCDRCWVAAATKRTVRSDDLCQCGHPWVDHDFMGDCQHLDGRTHTGYCERCRNKENT